MKFGTQPNLDTLIPNLKSIFRIVDYLPPLGKYCHLLLTLSPKMKVFQI